MLRTHAFLHACALFGALLCSCSSGPNRTELLGPTGGGVAGTSAGTGTGSGFSTGAGSSTGGNGTAAPNASGQASSNSTGITQDGGSCEQLTLTADRAAPDMLIVLDRSGSMTDNDSDTDRWAGSVDAINTVVGELEDAVRFGLMTFPGAEADNGGRGGWDDDDDENECAPGMLDVPITTLNAEPIAGTLMGMQADGRTPTAQTLQEARRVLAQTEPETLPDGEIFVGASQYVLLVTDGDPNCMGDGGGWGGGDDDTVAQQATIEEVGHLASDGVKTYVVGFQTAGSDFADVLDEAAVAGDTGDTMHRSVDSGDDLLDELRSIAGSAASCSFVLAQSVDESRVEIRVNGEPAEYSTGWDIRDDQRTIDLLGATCDALKAGAKVEAEVFCHVVNVI